MTVDEVMQFRRAKPFRPFKLWLTDGRSYVIHEPEQIGRNEAMTRIGIALDDGESGEAFDGKLVDRVEVIVGTVPPVLRRPAGSLV